MNDPILSRLGMCRKAGRLIIGSNASKDLIKQGKAKAVFCAFDVSEKTEKELKFFAEDKIPVMRLSCSQFELTHAIGISAGVVAVSDSGFANKITELLKDQFKEEDHYDD